MPGRDPSVTSTDWESLFNGLRSPASPFEEPVPLSMDEVAESDEREMAADVGYAIPASPATGSTFSGSYNFGGMPPFGRPSRSASRRAPPQPFNVTVNDSSYSGDDMLVGPVFGRSPDRTSILPHAMVVGTHRVGVEIELENITTSIGRSSRYWNQIQDGSLRNHGAEFIFRAPLGGTDLFNAMVEIDSHLHKLNPDDSKRCSTHVHIDVRDMTVSQLKNMILIYAVYERVLFQCSGWQRYRNNFCVALGFAQSMMKVLSSNWNAEDTQFLTGVTHRWDKYTAMNLLPMMDKGSVEFRISEAKWRKGQLLRLCNRFLSLKELAMSWEGSQEQLIEHLMREDISKILRKSLPRNLKDVTGDIQLGAKLAYDILYVHSMPAPAVVPANISDKCAIGILVAGTPDELITVTQNARAWDYVKDRIRGSRAATRIFGEVPDSQPEQMTFSFIFEISHRLSADPTWFVPRSSGDEPRPRSRYVTYRESVSRRS